MRSSKNLTLVGNTLAKNYLTSTFHYGKFPQHLNHFGHDFPQKIHVQVEGDFIELVLLDTSHDETKARFRPDVFPLSDVILAVFAIDNHDSLSYLEHEFHEEAIRRCPDTPVILVGTKSDLRGEKKQGLVTTEEVERVAAAIGAVDYVECSPKTKYKVEEVFAKAAKLALEERPKKRKMCVVV